MPTIPHSVQVTEPWILVACLASSASCTTSISPSCHQNIMAPRNQLYSPPLSRTLMAMRLSCSTRLHPGLQVCDKVAVYFTPFIFSVLTYTVMKYNHIACTYLGMPCTATGSLELNTWEAASTAKPTKKPVRVSLYAFYLCVRSSL